MHNNIICIHFKYKRASILYYEARLAFTRVRGRGVTMVFGSILFLEIPTVYYYPSFHYIAEHKTLDTYFVNSSSLQWYAYR